MQQPILITGAMEVEVDYLIEKLENKEEYKVAGYSFYKGNINNYPVVIAKTEIGIINATAAVTLAAQKYHPICIINQGTAGGIGKDIHRNDLVIGTASFNIMSAKTPCKDENEGSDSTKWDYITFVSGGIDEKILQIADEKLVCFFKQIAQNYNHGKVHKGIIGSGDIWNREKDRMIYLSKAHDVLCSEMEAIAVYTIANKYKIPVVAIKIISDNELLNESYERNLGKMCQEFVYEGITKITESMACKTN